MTIDDERRRDDLYDVRLRAHDQRLERDGWVYYVRGVRHDGELLPRTGVTSELLVDLPVLVGRGIRWATARVRRRRRDWVVGVVRLGAARTWRDVAPVVVHREDVPGAPGEDGLAARIDALVARAATGAFAPRSEC